MADEAEHLEFQRLHALRGTGLLTAPAPPELEEVCRRAKEHFRIAVAMVTLIDDGELTTATPARFRVLRSAVAVLVPTYKQ